MKNKLKHLIGLKVIKTENNSIYFEDGTAIDFHPFETYVFNLKENKEVAKIDS